LRSGIVCGTAQISPTLWQCQINFAYEQALELQEHYCTDRNILMANFDLAEHQQIQNPCRIAVHGR